MNQVALFFTFLLIGISLPAQNPWEDITHKAIELEKEGKWEEALLLRERASEAAMAADEATKTYLKASENVTRAEVMLNTSKDFQQAYDLMLKSVGELEAAGAKPLEISNVYRRLGMISYNHLYQPKASYSHTLNSVKYHEQSVEKDSAVLARTYHSLSVLSRQLGQFDESIAHFDKLFSLFREQDTVSKGITYRDYGALYGGKFLDMASKERMYLEQSKNLLESVSETNLQYLMSVYMELGILSTEMGDYKAAEGYLNKGIQVYRDDKEGVQRYRKDDLGDYPEISYNTNLIDLYASMGDEEKMLNALGKVEAIEKRGGLRGFENDMYVTCLKIIGDYYRNDEPNKALALYHKALNITQTKARTRDYTSDINIGLANTYYQLANYPTTLRLLQAVENDPEIGTRNRKGVYHLRAKVSFKINQIEEAIASVQQLIAEISPESFHIETDAPEAYVPGLGNDASYYLSVAHSIDTSMIDLKPIKEKLLWMALVEFENNVGNIPLNRLLKKDFDYITSGLMTAALQREFSPAESNRLLSFMENLTSRDMINNFLLNREAAANTELFKLVEEEQYVRSYITYLKKELQRIQDPDLKQQLFEKEQELDAIRSQLASEYRQGQLFGPQYVDLDNLGRNVVKFKATDDTLFKINIVNGKVRYQAIANYPTLKAEIETYLTLLNDLSTPVSTIKTQGEALYTKLMGDDFDHDLPTVIIPDDVLHYLPFELLVRDGRYVVENHTLSYASSFYFLNTNAVGKQRARRGKVVLFAPEYSGAAPESLLAVRGAPYSLAGAEAEVKGISQLVAGKAFLGSNASKSQFRSIKGDVSVLHLAMHSNLNDRDPELSNLLFSSSEPDYEMYISELYGLSFNADLAVLSACNTGVGGFHDGGNLVSMHHAFTIAGIPATVASLWNAPDESTKEIMIAFYKNLQKGDDKATALQQAKLDYLRNTGDENLQHPFYWAGFVLSGDESPIQLASAPIWKKPMVIFPLLGVCILAALGVARAKRRNKSVPQEAVVA